MLFARYELRLKKQSSIDLVVDKGALKQLLLSVLVFPPVIVIPAVLHAHLQTRVAKLANLPEAMLCRRSGSVGQKCHMWYSITQPDGSTRIRDVYAWFGIRKKSRRMK